MTNPLDVLYKQLDEVQFFEHMDFGSKIIKHADLIADVLRAVGPACTAQEDIDARLDDLAAAYESLKAALSTESVE